MGAPVNQSGARSLGAIFCALSLLFLAPEVKAAVSVARYAFAQKVVGKEPVGISTTFPADIGNLYFFTQITGADRSAELLHVWIYDGSEVAIQPIEVQGSPWRTWTVRAIAPEQKGDWTVEVREVGGKVLVSATCRIE